jgi:hypothetical protein
MITITGTSLDANSTAYILIDGVQCIVQNDTVTESELKCMTQYKDLAADECSDSSDPICSCVGNVCTYWEGCNDPNNPVCTCTEVDGVKTCGFALACADSMDNSC